MPSWKNRLVIRGMLEEIQQANKFVAQIAGQAGMSEDVIYNCQLAVDEICTNIIEHGYQLQGADKAIQVICGVQIPFFDITIIDEGPPFNPLNQLEPDPAVPLDQRGEGGWGIYFVKQMMDEVFYQRRDGFNHLLMRKRITSPTNSS
jgi:serine/threonine-protein kinase RsbW